MVLVNDTTSLTHISWYHRKHRQHLIISPVPERSKWHCSIQWFVCSGTWSGWAAMSSWCCLVWDAFCSGDAVASSCRDDGSAGAGGAGGDARSATVPVAACSASDRDAARVTRCWGSSWGRFIYLASHCLHKTSSPWHNLPFKERHLSQTPIVGIMG